MSGARTWRPALGAISSVVTGFMLYGWMSGNWSSAIERSVFAAVGCLAFALLLGLDRLAEVRVRFNGAESVARFEALAERFGGDDATVLAALQLLEHVALRTVAGCTFEEIGPDGNRHPAQFLGVAGAEV